MDSKLPRILQRRTTEISTWLKVISRDVQLFPDASIETHDAIGQPDYIVVLAVTADSRVLLVRQFRPALERFSLEFPAGLRD
jgi:ADP-ribose pyrophosphatase